MRLWYTLRRMKPWSAAWRNERISSVTSWRSGIFIGIPTLELLFRYCTTTFHVAPLVRATSAVK